MAMQTPASPPEGTPASNFYTPFVLFFYDWLLWLSNTFAWKCPMADVLLPLYRESLGERHLDVGAGTGYYPAKALDGGSARCREMTFVDLNPGTLEATRRKVGAAKCPVKISVCVADATQPPLPLPESASFDSISLFYLLHCLAGPPEAKMRVLDAVAPHLAPGGVLVGATILGQGRPANWLARMLLAYYNKTGVFGNQLDSERAMVDGLQSRFAEVEAWCEGSVLLFRARSPRAQLL